MAKYPCRNCCYFSACGEWGREMPCKGRMTPGAKRRFDREMLAYNTRRIPKATGLELPEEIFPGDVQTFAERLMAPEEVDHHYSDLYLKVTPISKAIVSRLSVNSLVETFASNLDGSPWYDLAFCYADREGEGG